MQHERALGVMKLETEFVLARRVVPGSFYEQNGKSGSLLLAFV